MAETRGEENLANGRVEEGTRPSSVRLTGAWAIAVAFTVLLGVLGVHFWTTDQATKASTWVAHTYQVGGYLQKVLSVLEDAETGQRGYLLTGNDAYLEPFTRANGRIDDIVADLRILTKDNVRQQDLISRMAPLITDKLDELRETISLQRTKKIDAAIAIVRSDRGKLIMDRIRGIIVKMESEEATLLVARQRDLVRMTTLSIAGEGIGIVFLIGIAAVVFFKIKNLNEELERRVAERTDALRRLSGRLISAQEDERSRMARELHDDFNQQLALLAVDIERLHDGLPGRQENLVDGLASLLRRTKELSSDVHRLSHQLHPSILQHLGLVAAARSFCKEISEQHDIHIELVHHEVPRSLANDIALCLYRIIQEALRNVIKHSGAKSARIEITKMEGELSLHISDNGIGFDPESDRTRRGLGLLSMRERLRQVDGTVSFNRIEPTGTRVEVRIQIPESNQQ